MKLEICIGSVHSALNAQAGGADRVELCDNLFEGDTTASYGAVKFCVENLSIGTMVIIRPRAGDFLFSPEEMQVMLADIKMARDLGVQGVVIGALKANGHVDVENCKRLVEAAGDLDVTFHRAFDMTIDWQQALEDVIGLGCSRLLSSGQEISSFEGAETLAKMVKQADGRISVMPGGGITMRNLERIAEITGVTEMHMAAHVEQASGMQFQHDGAFMGGELRKPEFAVDVAGVAAVANFKKLMN